VAGVIGSHRFLYDVWGDTVNLASRMESHGVPGRIHVSPQTSRILAGGYDLEPRGLINLRGIGKIKTSLLIGRKSGLLPKFSESEHNAVGSAAVRRP
jgi:adenylate cyclase